MTLTPEQEAAIEALNLGGHPANAPYIGDGAGGVRIDGTMTVAELHALMAIIDPAPSPQQTQRAVPIRDEDDRYTVERAADLLEGYVEFIQRDVVAADIERHPYVPEIEGTAKDLRQLAEGSRPKPGYVNDEKSDSFFEMAWKHGACGHTNFDGDDLASLTLTADDFVQFCAALTNHLASVELHNSVAALLDESMVYLTNEDCTEKSVAIWERAAEALGAHRGGNFPCVAEEGR